jgi:hypothetical protein
MTGPRRPKLVGAFFCPTPAAATEARARLLVETAKPPRRPFGTEQTVVRIRKRLAADGPPPFWRLSEAMIAQCPTSERSSSSG